MIIYILHNIDIENRWVRSIHFFWSLVLSREINIYSEFNFLFDFLLFLFCSRLHQMEKEIHHIWSIPSIQDSVMKLDMVHPNIQNIFVWCFKTKRFEFMKSNHGREISRTIKLLHCDMFFKEHKNCYLK